MIDKITEPGVYYDLPDDVYHAQHDWLSWSRMRNLITPSTPAHFKASLAASEERKRTFDLGKIVHHLALGAGQDHEIVHALDRQKQPYPARDYTTVSAQRHRDAIYEAGRIPILAHELTEAQAMADAIKAHPTAAALLGDGRPEVSLFWHDPDTGVKCRARIDWLPNPTPGRRLLIADVKTTESAAPRRFAKSAANFGYYGQKVHYEDGCRALGLGDPWLLFIAVEKADPHLVSVMQIADTNDLRLARRVVDHCRRLYADCTATDTWPGYGNNVLDLALPAFLHYDLEEHLP